MKHLASLLCLVFLTGCYPCFIPCILLPAPGKGMIAAGYYASAKPVIAALEKYHAEKNVYPASLKDLVPAYLEQEPAKLGYIASGGSYELSFSYAGSSAMNHCSYKPEAAKWNCFGYY